MVVTILWKITTRLQLGPLGILGIAAPLRNGTTLSVVPLLDAAPDFANKVDVVLESTHGTTSGTQRDR